jgi:hypothetical protein
MSIKKVISSILVALTVITMSGCYKYEYQKEGYVPPSKPTITYEEPKVVNVTPSPTPVETQPTKANPPKQQQYDAKDVLFAYKDDENLTNSQIMNSLAIFTQVDAPVFCNTFLDTLSRGQTIAEQEKLWQENAMQLSYICSNDWSNIAQSLESGAVDENIIGLIDTISAYMEDSFAQADEYFVHIAKSKKGQDAEWIKASKCIDSIIFNDAKFKEINKQIWATWMDNLNKNAVK